MPNQGLLAITFFESAAIFILLVLYLLLYRSLPERFFRLWVAGWIVYTGYGVSRFFYRWEFGTVERLVMLELLLASSVLFLAAILSYTGRRAGPPWLWPLTIAAGLALVIQAVWSPDSAALFWSVGLAQSAVFLAAGWVLWRHARSRASFGPVLLAGALLLRGLHRMDYADWAAQHNFLLRLAGDGLLEVAIGVAMVVLVLEDSRERAEDLNAKLRQLTLITAATTQTFKVEEVLREVLSHLVQGLRASHGLVRLLEAVDGEKELVLRAAHGFSERFHRQRARVRADEPWARRVLEHELPFLAYGDAQDPAVREWMQQEKLCALVLVRLPGTDTTLGMLGIGCHAPRVFRDDEINFLVNVANLLGLTVQNVWLFEQVNEAQQQWRYTFDSITDPILVHDTECRVLRVNRSLANRIGLEPQAIVGRPVNDLLRRGNRPWSRCPYCEGAGGQGDQPDATFGAFLLASNSEFHDATGARLGTIHVLKDVTDRNRAERMYLRLFENVREGVFISTPEGAFIDFNEAFMRMLGYESRDELMRADITSTFYVNPADRERLRRLLAEHGSVSNYEYALRRRDGQILHVSESSFAARDEAGRIVAFQGFILDVTERRQAEAELRRRNHDLMVLNSIALTLTQPLSLDLVLARALAQLVDLTGGDLGAIFLLDEKAGLLRRHAAVGFRSEFAEHFPPVPAPAALLEHIRRVRATVFPAQGLELPEVFQALQAREGCQSSHVVVLWSKERVLGGLVVGSRTVREAGAAELNLLSAAGNLIATTIEKTLLYEEARRAYDNLRLTQEQLLQSEKMAAVGQLISGVAHELNNPLTAILGYSQLLSGGDDVTSRGRDYVEKLYRQAQRTHRIVQNLLSFARQHKPERAPVRLNQVIEDTITLREYDLKLNNILLHRSLAPDLPPASGDSHQLQQVMLNILNNAVDAVLERGGRGEIWIETRAADGKLTVEITDSGAGVTDPLRVFDPFFTTKAVGKGTGLGLSICYGIIKEHGGEIRVRNVPPRGACFTVTLPVMPAGEEAQVLRELPRAAWRRILLVDDEEAVLELEREILSPRCDVLCAVRSGAEAVEALETDDYDAVVTDLKMPGEVSGRELHEWIREHRPALASRVVFVVSDAGSPDMREFLDGCGCPVVQKPFKVEELLEALDQACGARRPAAVTR